MKDHGRAQETVVIGAMRPLVIDLRSVLLGLDAGLVQRWRLRCGEVICAQLPGVRRPGLAVSLRSLWLRGSGLRSVCACLDGQELASGM